MKAGTRTEEYKTKDQRNSVQLAKLAWMNARRKAPNATSEAYQEVLTAFLERAKNGK